MERYHHYSASAQPRVVLASLLLGLSACSSFGSQPNGEADISGNVIQASGLPLANTTVAIVCANGAVAKQVPTDSLGRFLTSLELPGGAGANIPCSFGAPDSVNARFRAHSLIGFAYPGLPHPLQFVDLREGQP
jgi:hypothetical protein